MSAASERPTLGVVSGAISSELPSASVLAERLGQIDWHALSDGLDADGWAIAPALLSATECQAVAALYDCDELFRSRVVMARHGFGQGEYRYFASPLPAFVRVLREQFYGRLVPTANRWYEAMGLAPRFPPQHPEFLARCHAAGQQRPTPLLLRYGPGDYNCLHQDLYGEQVFPLQVVFLLSQPQIDFRGGEFVMTEQRPRMQSRPMVLPLQQGDAAVIAVRERPVSGTRGYFRVNLRHGVSRIACGSRHTLGIILHDAA